MQLLWAHAAPAPPPGLPSHRRKRQKCDGRHSQARETGPSLIRSGTAGCTSWNHNNVGDLCLPLIGLTLADYPPHDDRTNERSDGKEIVAFVRDARAMTAIKQQIRLCATDDGGR